MNKVAVKAKRAGGTARDAGDGKKDKRVSKAYCNTSNKPLSSLIEQASRFMTAADLRGDSDAWVDHFTIWQSLYAARYGLPWPGGAA